MSEPFDGSDALAERMAGLSPVKRALLELRLKQKRAGASANGAAPPPIPRRPDPASAPLSFAQQRLWFLDQLDPGSSLYSMPRQIRAQGPLDASALERALNALVARHEALRTSFPTVAGQPVQRIAPAEPLRIPVVELSHLPESEREAEAQRLADGEARRPFDLALGPLFRAQLLRLAPEDHLLLLTLHHIVSDGWSMGVLFNELGVLYEAFTAGTAPPLAELPIQYADYAAWQRDWLQGQVLDAHLSYWRHQFRGDLAPLPLPSAPPSPVGPATNEGAQLSFSLSAEVTQRLERLSRQEGATLFMTLLAAFKALLWRYTGSDDVVVASPVAGRTRPELEGLIGFFVNLLAFRTNVSGDPSFRELLGRVREVTLSGLAHQDLPFERLVEELQPERTVGRNPLMQVVFAFQNFPRSERRLAGVSLRQERPEKGLAKFDLGLGMKEDAGELRGTIKYNTDLFDAGTITRLAGHYQTLVEAAAANPDQALSALPILTDAERHQLLVDWRGAARPGWDRPAVHQLVEAQAARTPEAVAVVCGEERLSYAELNGRANQLARAMQAQGVGPGSYVPLLLPGGPDVVLAMLAVMKAGAAFVPLDLEWPLERLRGALRELPGGVALVAQRLPFEAALLERPVLVVDATGATAAGERADDLGLVVEGEAPLYAIFTSGSTGIPKAAVVPHRGISNRLHWMTEFFGPATAAAVLQTTRHVYDSAVWQLLWPLSTGGRTVLPGPGAEVSAEALARLIERHGVTITDFVPSVFNVLVPQVVAAAPLRAQLRSLRAVVVGGEEITPATTYQFMAAFPGVRVINLYGPTEASIGCICYEVQGTEGESIPIGRPIANVRALVLDPAGTPVPVGVAGELYLGGSCVGVGYLNDAEKTRASFVASALAEEGRRLYRTGDRVRYRADGQLEFLGRLDRQVKLRGLRIELGEIETALNRHPGVHASVVLLREDTPGDKRLVAYVVPGGTAPDLGALGLSELRSYLSRTLPEYMLPTVFVPLAELPRSPSGKVYRGALPRPDYQTAEQSEVGAEPRTTTELAVARIWAEVLRRDRVGIQQNFFDLGGHSLLATQVVARLRVAFGVELPLRSFFETPTVAGVAGHIETVHRLVAEAASLGPDNGQATLAAHEPTMAEADGMERESR